MTTQVIGMFIIVAVVVIVGLVLFVANARYSREEFGRTKALDEKPEGTLVEEPLEADELLPEEVVEEEEELEDPEEAQEDLEEIDAAVEDLELAQEEASEES
ncbi:MAG: hypothetical protein K0R69_592 [Clostridia bacterium]|jgi:flagellar biosynthesis/type III secretory pathway M-ring protein FliF/YscJ|nr:hypothetical protein [Clostridia bacterium]